MDSSGALSNGLVSHDLRPMPPSELSRLSADFYPSLPAQDSVLREYLRVLIKRKFIVISCVLLIFLLVLIATLRTTPIYEAAGTIAINKVDPGLITLKDAGNVGDYFDPADLDTEVKILRSDLLALQVIKQHATVL